MASIRKPGVQSQNGCKLAQSAILLRQAARRVSAQWALGPERKSLAAIRRGPPVLTATYSAPSVAAIKLHSAAGSASARLPQKVPRTWIR